MSERTRLMSGLALLALALWVNLGDAVSSVRGPVPGAGFHMLIVEKKEHREDLPGPMKDAMMSTRIDELVERAGGKKYVLGDRQDVSDTDDPWLIKAMTLEHESYPAVVIDMDGRGTSVPMQKNLEEHEKFVRGYLK